MKRPFVICFLVFVLLLLPRMADASHLVYFATATGGDKYFYMPETIKVLPDKAILAAFLREFSIPQSSLDKKLSVVVLNSETRQYKILATKSFDADGKELEESKFLQAAWQDIPARSVMEVLLNKVTEYLSNHPAPPDSDQSAKAASGSGFFIAPGIVVTNYHVISGAKTIGITYNNTIKATASVLGSDPAGDLALLKVTGLDETVKPLVLGNSAEVKEGTRIYVVGFPLSPVIGTTAKITEGLVSSITGINNDARQFQISAPVQPGNSGGPLLNERGEVLGVVSAQLGSKFAQQTGILPQNVNFAVKASNIKNLMGSLLPNENVPASHLRSTLSGPDIMEIAKKGLVYITVTR